MLAKVRSYDRFGSPVSLKLDGEREYKTVGGGCISLGLHGLILSFFCMQLIHVI